MKVSEFIEWLKTQDQDAIVLVAQAAAGPWSTYTVEEEFSIEDHSDYVDLRNNPFTDDEERKKRRTLMLGSTFA